MKNSLVLNLLIIAICAISCKEKIVETTSINLKPEIVKTLPFQSLDLTNLENFQETGENWQIVGKVYVDRSKEKTMMGEKGVGILFNNPTAEHNNNVFTNFEHGDIELELDVMMPVKSNSGIYFQGRYEIQLLDSWNVEDPGYGDIGGIYQRWDNTKPPGEEGFEGHPPKTNAAKSPGLWQHMKIVFHAPKFDNSGNKIKNAQFEEVWLNGVLIHKEVELSGPTAGGEIDETSMAALMIQGDHGAVAFKNIRYKLYSGEQLTLSDISMTEYQNKQEVLPALDSLTPIREIRSDSVSALMVSGDFPQKILKYTGTINIPRSGDYIFDMKVNTGGGLFLIDKDTIVNLNGRYNIDSLGYEKVHLNRGALPFTLIYNKFVPWTLGFSLEGEGPEIQKHRLTTKNSLNINENSTREDMVITVSEEVVTQRSFLMHKGYKRTHCISVGTPEKINYSYDMDNGALLNVWNNKFLDATPMWLGRGEKQLGVPAGFTVTFNGDPSMAVLENGSAPWPDYDSNNTSMHQLGYELDQKRLPAFAYKLGNVHITDQLIPLEGSRGLQRSITVEGKQPIYHKLAEGEAIELLPDGTYIVNDESYFIRFSEHPTLKPFIRKNGDNNELLVAIPSGKQHINYNIIW